MADRHYIIVYRPTRLTFPADATDGERAVIGDHFRHLAGRLAAGRLSFAGRTEAAEFGIAVFSAASDCEAEAFVNDDPAVRAGIFRAEWYPYLWALPEREGNAESTSND